MRIFSSRISQPSLRAMVRDCGCLEILSKGTGELFDAAAPVVRDEVGRCSKFLYLSSKRTKPRQIQAHYTSREADPTEALGLF